ncbi:MAG TPA: acyltransferase [Solirubrobacteraceae bacterium]|jgi:peptidoglycan/LPS O-acetylase OafA/YrhL|nr:acyltransferase [Solirubrobacteraceae bacterium]
MTSLVTRRAAAVDGLRAVAALSVVAYHAWLYTLPTVTAAHRETLADRAIHEFRLGLVLFFVLSGFLLYQPWVRSALGDGPEPRLGSYLVRRAARILPAYYLAVAGSIALLWSLRGATGVRLPAGGDLWTFAVFGQNFSDATVLKLDPPLWTLAVEVSFYLALPFLGWLALRLRHSGRAGQLAVPLAFLLGGLAYNRAIDGGAANWPTKILPAMAGYFAIGMLAAVLLHGREPTRRLTYALFAGGALLVLGDAWWAADEATRGSHSALLHVVRDLPAAAGFACILAAASGARHPPRLLAARPVAWTGQVSYGVYLWHVPLLLFLRAHSLLPLSPLGALIVVAPIALTIAAASWYAVERPLQDRARRATRRPTRPAAARQRPVVAPGASRAG